VMFWPDARSGEDTITSRVTANFDTSFGAFSGSEFWKEEEIRRIVAGSPGRQYPSTVYL
jgi:hypothetical protein